MRAATKKPSRATALLVAIVLGAWPVLVLLPPPCEKPEFEPDEPDEPELEPELDPEELVPSLEVSIGAFPLVCTLPPPLTPGTDSGALVADDAADVLLEPATTLPTSGFSPVAMRELKMVLLLPIATDWLVNSPPV